MIILIFAGTKTGKRCTHFGYLCIHCTIIVYTLILALNNYHSEPEAKHFSGTLHKILGFGILADFLVSFFSEIPSLLMGPDWKPDLGNTPDESQLGYWEIGFQYS